MLPAPRHTLFPYTTALPICQTPAAFLQRASGCIFLHTTCSRSLLRRFLTAALLLHTKTNAYAFETPWRSEEHTSELQSREKRVCRLLHEKKESWSVLGSAEP